MKIVFFGTSDFANSPLNALSLSKHKIIAVVTAADKRKGRGLKRGVSGVKVFAQKKGLPLFQPTDLQDTKFIESLKKMCADLFVVAAYGKILTKDILQIPSNYAINLHASLLPKYRGAAPINWAIVQGEKESGVTVFKMNEYMDEGEIILQEKMPILSTETAISLGEKFSRIGAKTLVKAVDLIEQGAVSFTAQDKDKASLAPKLKKSDGLIDWKTKACEIHNRVRGLQPWPGAFTYLNNKLLKIWESRLVPGAGNGRPGEIVEVDNKKGILVQTGKDKLLITHLQLEGKGKMPTSEFILGHTIETGEKLGK